MLQNNLIPNISLPAIASVMSRVNSLAWFYFVIWINTRSDAGYEIFSLTIGINNHLEIIHMNLIICCILRGQTCRKYITQPEGLLVPLVNVGVGRSGDFREHSNIT